MADTKFAELKTAIRQAELQREIADLPSSPKALRQLITILSEQGTANLKTDTGFGYLRAITQITKTLEDVPPRLWGEAIGEIDYVVSFAERDPFMAPDELDTLQSVVASLKSEIQRQTGLAIRTGAFLARGVKRMGESLLERGASSSNLLVRMASKLVQAGIERRRTTKEVGKEFARTRSGALGTVSTYRTTPIGFSGDLGGSLSGGLGVTSPTASEPQQLNLPLKIEVEQLSELKKINSTLARQITVAENIDEKNEKQRAIEQSRTGFAAMESGLETPRMTLAGTPTPLKQNIAIKGKTIFDSIIQNLTGSFQKFLPIIEGLGGAIVSAIPFIVGLGAAAYGVKKAMDLFSAYKGYTEGQDQRVKDEQKNSDVESKNMERARDIAVARAKMLGDDPNAPAGAFLSPIFYLNKTNKMGIFKPGSAELLPGKELPGKETTSPQPLTPTRTFGAEMVSPTPSVEPTRIGSGDTQYNLRQSLASQGILDPRAQANIFAQIQGESGFELKDEDLRYSPQRLFDLFGPGNEAGNKVRVKTLKDAENIVAQGPEAIGNLLYGGRMGNAGNEGFLYRGRGYIQLTGKSNYKRIGDMIGVDLVKQPDLVNDPIIGAQVVGAFYKMRQGKSDLTNIADVNRMTGFATGAPEAQKRAQTSERFLAAFSTAPSMNRNATPVATASNALAAQGQQVVVMNAPTTAPIVNVQGGGSTVIPMPIRAESIENTLLAMTRLNYV